jgi:hypothetical protein
MKYARQLNANLAQAQAKQNYFNVFNLSGFVYIILVASPMNGSNFTGLSGFCLDIARFRIKIMSKYLILNNIAQLYNVKAEYNQNIRGNNIPL